MNQTKYGEIIAFDSEKRALHQGIFEWQQNPLLMTYVACTLVLKNSTLSLVLYKSKPIGCPGFYA